MVLLSSEFDTSRFLNAKDLDGPKKFRIKSVTAEEIGEEKRRKPVLWFTNHEKGWPLNVTNRRVLTEAFGDVMDDWAGKIIVVFPTKVDLRGKLTDGLRTRIPPPKQAAGNGHAATSAPKPTPPIDPELDELMPPVKKPRVDDDMDDEIGF